MSNDSFIISEAVLGNKSIRYLTAGGGDEFAVILQGWATDRKVYSLITSCLAQKYRVIFPLLPGFGGEKEPTEPMSVSDYAELVDALLRHLGVERATFFCHSYGGRIFFKLAAKGNAFTAPKKVILCDAAGIMPKRSAFSKLKIKVFKLTRRILSTAVMRFLYPELLPELLAKSGSDDYRNSSPIMRRTLVLAVNEDLTSIISLVKAPTLIIWGKNDEALPLSDAYTMEKCIEGSAVVVFEKSGHFPFATEWAGFRAVMSSFLEIEGGV